MGPPPYRQFSIKMLNKAQLSKLDSYSNDQRPTICSAEEKVTRPGPGYYVICFTFLPLTMVVLDYTSIELTNKAYRIITHVHTHVNQPTTLYAYS